MQANEHGALRWAARKGCSEVVRSLLKAYGAPGCTAVVSGLAARDWYALRHAIRKQRFAVILQLLDASGGAWPRATLAKLHREVPALFSNDVRYAAYGVPEVWQQGDGGATARQLLPAPLRWQAGGHLLLTVRALPPVVCDAMASFFTERPWCLFANAAKHLRTARACTQDAPVLPGFYDGLMPFGAATSSSAFGVPPVFGAPQPSSALGGGFGAAMTSPAFAAQPGFGAQPPSPALGGGQGAAVPPGGGFGATSSCVPNQHTDWCGFDTTALLQLCPLLSGCMQKLATLIIRRCIRRYEFEVRSYRK